MKEPLCRTCGERHRYGPCTMTTAAHMPTVAENAKDLAEGAKLILELIAAGTTSTKRVKRWRAKNRERYNETMRAYRKRKKDEPET